MPTPTPLQTPMRVLEAGRGLGVAACCLHLVALGADVVQLALDDRRLPGAERAYYDRGRTVVPVAAGPALARAAEVLVTDLSPAELAAAGLPADEAALAGLGGLGGADDGGAEGEGGGDQPPVLVSILPLGRTVPSASLRMTDITEWAAGGLATVTRRPYYYEDDDERCTPVLPPGHQSEALAGLAAASGTFAGRRLARRTGAPVVVDVSVQEVTAATLHSTVPNFVFGQHLLGHPGVPTTALGMTLPAADGDIYLRVVEAHQWQRLVDWLGDPEWFFLGEHPADRVTNRLALQALFGERTAPQLAADLVAEGQRRKVPVTIPRSLAEVLEWQQLQARGVWVDVDGPDGPARAPRLPMVEPAAWRPTVAATAAEVADRWDRQ